MLKIGLTGGIGAGKSTICHFFELLGVPVYYADLRGREISSYHPEAIAGFKELFGSDIYIDGELDRKRVASIVFSDKERLRRVNALVHPIVADDFNNWCQKNVQVDFVIKEAAILFESNGDKEVDRIISVVAPEEVRIERVMRRDSVSESMVRQRIANQMNDKERQKRSDFIITCDDVELVLPQILKIFKQLKNSNR